MARLLCPLPPFRASAPYPPPPLLALQKARKEGPPTVAQLFARAVGAALSRLVDLLGASVEDARKVRAVALPTGSASCLHLHNRCCCCQLLPLLL